MRDICMINVDKQTYLTQTSPSINGQTSDITSQKRKAGPTGEISYGRECIKYQELQNTDGDHAESLPGIGKVTATNCRGSSNDSQEHVEVSIRSFVGELYWGSYQGMMWNPMGNDHPNRNTINPNISLLTAGETSLLRGERTIGSAGEGNNTSSSSSSHTRRNL